MNPDPKALLRQLPSVDAVVSSEELSGPLERHGRALVVAEARRQLDAARTRLARPGTAPVEPARREALAAAVAAELDRRADGRLIEVINATGVLVHTNLGRAPLGDAVIRRVAERAGGCVNLELDLETGRRGRRGAGSEELLRELTGAEAACVVNNNAAALVLALNTFALGRSVVVSRGELVEIGGSFRVPDICERAGVRLVEVGTTNRTRIDDYRAACGSRDGISPGLLLKVHPSNFAVVGFTEDTPLAELVALGRQHDLPVVMDQGSGALDDLGPFGVTGETPVGRLVASGADLVLFSGDKLLGGPQAGCIVGRQAAVKACRENPLFRALRVGRLTELALEATLWAHAAGALDQVPVQARLRLPAEVIRERAAAVTSVLLARCGSAVTASVEPGSSTSGGGSSPTSAVATHLLRVSADGLSATELATRLRLGRPPILARIADDAVLLDLRTVATEQDAVVTHALCAAVGAA